MGVKGTIHYLYGSGPFVPAAGDVHHERPLVRLHQHARGLGTRGVVGGGTAAVRALHAAARRLLHALLAVVAFLTTHRQGRKKHI